MQTNADLSPDINIDSHPNDDNSNPDVRVKAIIQYISGYKIRKLIDKIQYEKLSKSKNVKSIKFIITPIVEQEQI